MVTCADWCECLPATATLQTLSFNILETDMCCDKVEEIETTLTIGNVPLVLNSTLCQMVSSTGGNWTWNRTEKQYSCKPGGVKWPGCPQVPCAYNCCNTDLCRTLTTSGIGTNPGIVISCGNPCQESSAITDAFPKMQWLINGNFRYTEVGSNAHAYTDAYLACRGLPKHPCSPDYDFDTGNYTDSRVGELWGQRGCLTSNSFNQFNICPSIRDHCAYQTLWLTGYSSCTGFENPIGAPNCYECAKGTVEHRFIIPNTYYTVKGCVSKSCCCCVSCTDYTVSPPAEIYCCDSTATPGACVSCQTIWSNCSHDRQQTIRITANVILVTP